MTYSVDATSSNKFSQQSLFYTRLKSLRTDLCNREQTRKPPDAIVSGCDSSLLLALCLRSS